MAIGPRLDLRHTQSLVMTPQLRQAIKLLQSSNMEVSAFVEEELERNPLLERDEGNGQVPEEALAPDLPPAVAPPRDSFESTTAATMPPEDSAPLDIGDWSNVYDSEAPARGGRADFELDERGIEELAVERPRNLREELAEQVRLSFSDPAERLIAAQLIALLDGAGRLAVPDESIAEALGCEVARVAAIRARMQRFEPVGMFCRDLAECLAVQLAERNRLDPAMAALLENLEMLARRDMRGLMRACGVDAEDLADMVAELKRLDPKPGAGFDQDPTPALVPDVLMRPAPITTEDGESDWILELNPETLPRVLINRGFHARAQVGASRECRAFLTEQLQSANWLVKSLEQRAQTILKVSAEIVRRQDGFFRHGISSLRPLILRDVAEAVEMHESTVSRVTANKYIATPRGNFELKYFFTTAIGGTDGETFSAEAIRHRIRAMVDAESPDDILSDDAIVAMLKREGVDIARRTVAKYREALRIPSSVQRKREKAVPA
ncbi:RNA polymerase factor sigma-54 [Roseomonas marmotae]|uniref:RNA polymerase sigma-54 factor n=1 Tax=Roseomonas marmotae TaxID=2768161 RepID=A0ABS3KCB2_9PROT|nr:RNA polymerase factor sigma-54 [Roseomonas marmotae]MBO1075119.1 RNA polymerase factor sigma-54 [Roseomonas marmotae]QTI79766.1 RNA polymerase factor sigma-54 [Roseomonas marmotae]